MRPMRLLILVGVASAVVACSSAQPAPPTPEASPSAAPSVTAPPSASPDEPTATPEPAATPEPTPEPSLSAKERDLIGTLRTGVGVDCSPRHDDLPPGAMYGIECRPDDSLVQRVGVYRYPSPNEAAFAYMTRMVDAGIDVNEGDCVADRAGEGAYFPGDEEGNFDDPGVFNWENSALMPERNGCFLDEFGNANVRLVCGDTYIGILGARDDLSDLLDWSWTYPKGYEPGTPDVPGLCVGPSLVGSTP